MRSVLCEVLTPAEVAKMWDKHLKSVMRRLDRGCFRYRYTSTGYILIERASVEAVWGAPRMMEISVMDVVR